MSLSRLLRRTTTALSAAAASSSRPPISHLPHPTLPHSHLPLRSFAYSSAEEAAAERRRRKRRLRIEPPLHALRRDPSAPRPPPDPNAPRLPDSTSSLVGPRLNLHNRVQSLIRAGDLDSASTLSRQAVFSRTRPTVFTCNAIIAAMYRAKRYDDSVALFHFFFNQSNIVPNVVSYNFLIVSHCESGRVDDGLEVYRHILANAPFSPSSVTYRHLTKGLIDSDRIAEAVDLLRDMLSKGHGADSLVYNNLIKGFLDLGDLGRANELFGELKERCLVYDGVVNATFMDWFFNQGKDKEAMESYKGLMDREFRMTPATCNVLLECLLRHGREKEASELFDSMLDNHTPPNFQAVNSDTFNIMVNECFRLGKFDEAVKAFRKVGVKANSKPFSMDVAGYNNIIVRFAENGKVEEAEKFFEELRSKSLSPDVTGYRTLIDAYLKEKRVDDAVQMFHLMVDANLRVLPEYASRWFGELVENDKVLESSELLMKLGEKEPKPDVVTYEIVIKGLCNARAYDRCKEIVSQMMGYGVGVTPTLRQFLLEVFEKEGQKDEIEKLLDRKRQDFGPRWQPNGPAGAPRPAGLPGPAASPRFPQSAVSSGSANQFGAHAGSVGVQRQAGSHGQGENAAFTRSYEFTGASASIGATGFAGTAGYGGYTGSAYQSGTQAGPIGHRGQMENPRYPSMNEPAGFSGSVAHDGHTGYSRSSAAQFGPSGYNENASNQDAYKPFGFSTQAGTTRSPEPAGYGGSNDQFAAQTRPMGPSGHTENARYQGAYEPNGFSAQSSSTRIPDHFVHQSRQWSQHQSGQWSQHQSGQWSQHQNGQWSQPGRPEDASHQGIRQPAEPVHEQDGYARSLNMSNR